MCGVRGCSDDNLMCDSTHTSTCGGLYRNMCACEGWLSQPNIL